MTRVPRAILWDWDGTLADGWPAVTAALNEVFAAFAMPAWTLEETRARARRSVRESFPEHFGADWQRAARLFGEAFARTHLSELRSTQDAEAALDAAARWPLAVISNKDGAFVRRECDRLGWTDRFRSVLGAGDAAADKPDPAPFRLALAPMGIGEGPEIWYVGDTGLDMQAARAWGCTAVLLGDAAHDGGLTALREAGLDPDLHFSHASALAAHLERLA